MDNLKQVPSVSTAETEQFWAGADAIRQPETGANPQPETKSTTSNNPAGVGAHGICRRCFKPSIRDIEGVWRHVEGRGLAEPIGIDMPGVGVVRPGVSPDICAGRESAVGEVGERSPGLVDGAEFSSKPDSKEAATDGDAPAGDGTRPRGHEDFEDLIKDLGELVLKADPDSALEGLECVAIAFGYLLDVYAGPNPENPAGMCDDSALFRQHFARILTGGAR